MDSEPESTPENPNTEQLYYTDNDMVAKYPNEDGLWVKGTLYATYGGGPEGGWFDYTCAGVSYLFRVHRTWGTPFVLNEQASGYLKFHSDQNGDWVTYYEGDKTESA